MIDIDIMHDVKAKIRVIGVGGGGNNAVDRMVEEKVANIEFISANTDNMALAKSKAGMRIQLGEKLTRGLGAGGKPEMGRRAAEETREVVSNAIEGTNLLFITAGMGGGTGTGAAPVIASIARDLGILTVGVVTKPFAFEGGPRMRKALDGIDELRKTVDTLVVIPNQRLLEIIDDDTSIVDSFRMADEVLHQGVKGISGLILDDGLINLDFADVETVMRGNGHIAHMGVGRASGKNKVMEAAEKAINSPLLETSIHGAKALLISFTGDGSMTMKDVNAAADYIRMAVDPEAEIIMGSTINDSFKDEVMVTVVATGLSETSSVRMTMKSTVKAAPAMAVKSDDVALEEPEQKDEPQGLRSVRDANKDKDADTPFEIPIFLQRKKPTDRK
jgi:cell division protein FtsZ